MSPFTDLSINGSCHFSVPNPTSIPSLFTPVLELRAGPLEDPSQEAERIKQRQGRDGPTASAKRCRQYLRGPAGHEGRRVYSTAFAGERTSIGSISCRRAWNNSMTTCSHLVSLPRARALSFSSFLFLSTYLLGNISCHIISGGNISCQTTMTHARDFSLSIS